VSNASRAKVGSPHPLCGPFAVQDAYSYIETIPVSGTAADD
jgi:hypothetical protein